MRERGGEREKDREIWLGLLTGRGRSLAGRHYGLWSETVREEAEAEGEKIRIFSLLFFFFFSFYL